MYRYERLLVGLKLNESDESTLQYAAKITRMAQSKKVYFVHIAETFDLPQSIKQKLPEAVAPVDEVAMDKLREVVETYFVDFHSSVEIDYVVREGNPLTELLQLAHQKWVDMVVVGKSTKAGRLLAEKVARKAPCSVCIIPRGAAALITKILTPIDFSEYSQEAMDVAIAFASTARQQPNIYCLHVFSIPRGYSYYNTPEVTKDFIKAMRLHARKRYIEFIRGFDLKGVPVSPLLEIGDHIPAIIAKIVKQENADLLVLGVRGMSNASAILLGGTTEKLIRSTDVPLIVVKRKGENLGLLEMLFGS